MQKINSLTFGALRNAEHVSFFTNVAVSIDKATIAALGIAEALYKQYKAAVDVEQDIVNHSNGSVYTPEMQAMDAERDRLFRLIRLKLQAATLAGKNSDLFPLVNTIDKYLLTKYSIEIVNQAYQEESALLRGFILDCRNLLDEDEIAMVGITAELDDLESYNNRFADQYNERVTEKSGSTTEASKKARKDCEDLFALIGLHLEYKANTDTTDVGAACAEQVGIINQIVKDAKQRLNQRLGKADASSSEDVEDSFEENVE